MAFCFYFSAAQHQLLHRTPRRPSITPPEPCGHSYPDKLLHSPGAALRALPPSFTTCSTSPTPARPRAAALGGSTLLRGGAPPPAAPARRAPCRAPGRCLRGEPEARPGLTGRPPGTSPALRGPPPVPPGSTGPGPAALSAGGAPPHRGPEEEGGGRWRHRAPRGPEGPGPGLPAHLVQVLLAAAVLGVGVDEDAAFPLLHHGGAGCPPPARQRRRRRRRRGPWSGPACPAPPARPGHKGHGACAARRGGKRGGAAEGR